ncbi:MAG: hypothetical protein K6G30_00635, partial [Acetatifactor sp.]|nr:hypothetical protein [Acetatifactor sp.]
MNGDTSVENNWVRVNAGPTFSDVANIGLQTKCDVDFLYGGIILKLTYSVKNTTNDTIPFALACGADVQIGGDDHAPITKIEVDGDATGFSMKERGVGTRFNFFGIGYKGVTDVDGFWYGAYDIRRDNYFADIPTGDLTNGEDSGATWHWKNRSVAPGETKQFSVLIGIGGEDSVNAAKTYKLSLNGGHSDDYRYGRDEVVTINADYTDGEIFNGWTVNEGEVTLADSSAPTTTFTMPTRAVKITANVEHNWADDYTIDRAATCQETGEKSIHCQNEGCTARKEVTEIPKTEHDIEEVKTNINERPCGQTSSYTLVRKCKDCGTIISSENVTYQGTHSYDNSAPVLEWADDYSYATVSFDCDRKAQCGHTEVLREDVTNVNTATCTEGGMSTITAEFNFNGKDYRYTTKVATDPLGHHMTHTAATTQSCIGVGNTEYWYCDRCDKYFSTESGLLPNGESSEIELEATVIPIATIGYHDMTTHHERVESTCSATGVIEYWTCGNCDKKFSTASGTKIVGGELVSSEVTDEELIVPKATLGHHHMAEESTPAVAATCTSTGNIEYWTCEDCHKLFSTATGTKERTIEPEEEGQEPETVIESSEVTLEETVTPVISHTLLKHSAKGATCEEAGNITYWECTACHKTFRDADAIKEVEPDSVIIVKRPHIMQHTDAVSANCTKSGNIEYWTCDTCGKIYRTEDGVYPLGSEHEGESSEVALADTVINASGHNMTHHDAVEETCDTAGNIEYWSCDRCNKCFTTESGFTEVNGRRISSRIEEEDTVIDPMGHLVTRVPNTTANCEHDGNIAYYHCSRCENNFKDINSTIPLTAEQIRIAKKAHIMSHTEAVAPTCTEFGNIEYWTCETCGNYFTTANGYKEEEGEEGPEIVSSVIANSSVTLAALGHDYIEDVEAAHLITAATCSDKAVYYKSCSRCEHEYGGTFETGTPLGHHFTKHNGTSATCTASGLKDSWSCDVCNKLYGDSEEYSKNEIEAAEVIPALGHNFTKTELQDATTLVSEATCT